MLASKAILCSLLVVFSLVKHHFKILIGYIELNGSGTITFTKLDGDSLYFTTASGKSGVFNIKNSRYNFK